MVPLAFVVLSTCSYPPNPLVFSGKMLRLAYAAEPLFQVLELQMLGYSGVTQILVVMVNILIHRGSCLCY